MLSEGISPKLQVNIFHTKYEKQERAIEYAMEQISASPIADIVTNIILFGSCARGEERFDSDVDLFLTLDTKDVTDFNKLRKQCRQLKSDVITENIEDAEVDLKIAFYNEWKTSNSLIYQFIRKEGISLWTK